MKIGFYFSHKTSAYTDKNQLQKSYQEINSEQEPGTQAIFKLRFLYCYLIHFCKKLQSKSMKQLLGVHIKKQLSYISFSKFDYVWQRKVDEKMNKPILQLFQSIWSYSHKLSRHFHGDLYFGVLCGYTIHEAWVFVNSNTGAYF